MTAEPEDRVRPDGRPGPPDPRVREFALPGHRKLVIRPMRPEDGPALVALYAGLDESDTYRRFLASRPPPEAFVLGMASVARGGGEGLVATMSTSTHEITTGAEAVAGTATDTGTGEITAEATYSPLPNGDAELGITVARKARGWLGPYLLDALLEVAAAHGIPNLEADVLMGNAQMLGMVRRRGYAVMAFDGQPALLRVVVGTAGKMPSWPGQHVAPRVLVEVPGGCWYAEEGMRDAGFEVIGCPSPPGGWAACPARVGGPCPLALGADVIVDAIPGELGRSQLDVHRAVHPHAALVTESGPGDPDPGAGVECIRRGAPVAAVVATLAPLAARSPALSFGETTVTS